MNSSEGSEGISEVSEKSRGVALALAVPFGVLGLHRFYLGKIGTGLLMFLTGGGAGLWWILDLANLASGGFRDSLGYRVVEWGIEPHRALRPTAPEYEEELDALNDDLDDVTERLEAAERRLALRRELPPNSG